MNPGTEGEASTEAATAAPIANMALTEIAPFIYELRRELEARGIVVRCPSNVELAEEAPIAYKDIERVVDVVHTVGIARKVARMRPLGVIKG